MFLVSLKNESSISLDFSSFRSLIPTTRNAREFLICFVSLYSRVLPLGISTLLMKFLAILIALTFLFLIRYTNNFCS